MIRTLRYKFVLVLMCFITVMLCVILGLVYFFTKANLEDKSISMMQTIGNEPYQAEWARPPGTETDLEVNLPFFVVEVDLSGELLTSDNGYYDLSDLESLQELVNQVLASPRTIGVLSDYNLRYYQTDTGFGVRLVFSDISNERATLSSLLRNCILIGIIAFLIFLGVSILLSGWVVRPVEQAWSQQKQFVADASHELKTPLTVIMTNAELAESGKEDPEKQPFLDNILLMCRQMKILIEQMLELARADSAVVIGGQSQPVDFGRLVSDAVLPFEPVFFENENPLTVSVEEPVMVKGDEQSLQKVIEILLDNAAKYTKETGKISVTLKKYGAGHCLLTVADEGEPLSSEELKDIFKRFYRTDKARSRNGSFGLGLSIAEGIVLQHKGKIWAESKNEVNSFYVLLPVE
ncbi:MAG: HAMP domain-containing histidine kinase [Lachnospiraceae bacterium]|nr:HAMP domain-containing histidine kinase [Lachnospiraceae bacterium]